MLKKILKSLSSVGLIFVVALLGAWAGQEKKWLRRFVLPAIVTIYTYFLLQNWWVLTIYSMAGVLSIGYGIPEYKIIKNDVGKLNYIDFKLGDEGSFIGRFFYKLFKQSELWANVCTRGTVGLLISFSMLSIPILKGTWISFLIGSTIIIGIWSAVSWRGFGETRISLFGKEVALLNVDLTTYAVTSCGFLIIIHGFLG